MLMDASRCFTLQSCTTSQWYQTLENPFPSPAAMSQSIALYFWPDIKIPQILGENMDSQNNPNCLTRNWLEALCTGRNWLERKRTKGEAGIVSSCFCDWFMKWFWQSLSALQTMSAYSAQTFTGWLDIMWIYYLYNLRWQGGNATLKHGLGIYKQWWTFHVAYPAGYCMKLNEVVCCM